MSAPKITEWKENQILIVDPDEVDIMQTKFGYRKAKAIRDMIKKYPDALDNFIKHCEELKAGKTKKAEEVKEEKKKGKKVKS